MRRDKLEWIDDDHIYGHDEIGQRMRRCIQLHEKIRLLVYYNISIIVHFNYIFSIKYFCKFIRFLLISLIFIN